MMSHAAAASSFSVSFVRTCRSHRPHRGPWLPQVLTKETENGQMASRLRHPEADRRTAPWGRGRWVDEDTFKKRLEKPDTKQLTKCCFNRGGGITGHHLLGDDTSPKRSFCGQFISLCGSMLSSMCLRSMHAWCGSEFPAQPSRSEASWNSVSPAEMIAQCSGKWSGKKQWKGWLTLQLINPIPYHGTGIYLPTWIVDFSYNPGVISYIIY